MAPTLPFFIIIIILVKAVGPSAAVGAVEFQKLPRPIFGTDTDRLREPFATLQRPENCENAKWITVHVALPG